MSHARVSRLGSVQEKPLLFLANNLDKNLPSTLQYLVPQTSNLIDLLFLARVSVSRSL